MEEAQKYVWEGAIPLQIHLHESEVTTLPTPPPALILAPRIGYLPLLVPQIKPHFSNALPPGSPDTVWFDYNGLPLKWYIPTGVLFDLLCAEPERPWNLTVHFRGYPSNILVPCEGEDSVKWSFINSLKEASEAIQAIALPWKRNFKFEEFPEVFLKMSNLRLLIINGFDIPDALDFPPNSLKYLSLDYSSLKCLPSSFQPKELVHLDLPFSKFEYLWEGEKRLGKLKFIDLSFSTNLIRTPDFSGVPRLVQLKLGGCSNLVEIHPSIGQLSRLKYLDLICCVSLTNLPSMSAEMQSLTTIRLYV